jgi:multiple sugar transport system substrate-binding protein
MSRKSFYAVALIAALVLVLGALPAAAQEKAVVTWFVGLGTGTQAEQIEVQNQVVADFNASQDEVELVINIAASNETARDTLSTLIAAGTPPDIVGPVGVGGSNAYVEQWADLTPLVEATGFDLSIFDPALVDLYRTADGQLLGIPFATFPSILYFNRGLFDEAGLEYPPQEFGAPYVLDGEEVPWNYETVREIAKILTVDAAGNDATSADFDPANIVQFGLNFQWARTRLIWTDLQPEVFYDFETGTATIPESWRTATQWWRDLVWEDHSIPTTAYDGSELLATGNAFSSGNLAMAVTPLWYTCCLDNSVGNFEWDLAVVPQSLDGEYHVATDADTFRLLKGSANPEAAFKALSYLLTDAVPSLTAVYGAFPAHPAYQQADIDKKTERYPWDINWQVAVDSLAYNNPGPVHHEADFPNWQKGHDRIDAFQNLLLGETGAEIDVAAELDKLEADVNAIIDEVTG